MGTSIYLCHVRESLQREPLITLLGSGTKVVLCILQFTSLMLLIDKLSALKLKKTPKNLQLSACPLSVPCGLFFILTHAQKSPHAIQESPKSPDPPGAGKELS